MSENNQFEEQLVRFFKDKVDVSELTPQLVEAYVLAKDTAGVRREFASEYDRRAKLQGVGTVYDSNGVNISVSSVRKPEKPTPKERVGIFQNFLFDTLDNNVAGKQMYGVKRFEDGSVVAVEAEHLLNTLNNSAGRILGYINSVDLCVNGDVDSMVNQFVPYLQSDQFMPDANNASLDDSLSVGVYLASKSQAKLLGKNIVTPFEGAFKEISPVDDSKTIWTPYHYGSATVEVMAIPQPKAPWSKIIGEVSDKLGEYSRLGSENCGNGFLYMNNDLVGGAKMYVAVNHIADIVSGMRNNREIVHRKEVDVKYNAGDATIISVA